MSSGVQHLLLFFHQSRSASNPGSSKDVPFVSDSLIQESRETVEDVSVAISSFDKRQRFEFLASAERQAAVPPGVSDQHWRNVSHAYRIPSQWQRVRHPESSGCSRSQRNAEVWASWLGSSWYGFGRVATEEIRKRVPGINNSFMAKNSASACSLYTRSGSLFKTLWRYSEAIISIH